MIKALIFDVGGVLCLTKDIAKRDGKNLLTSYKEVCSLMKDIGESSESVYENTIDIYKKSSIGEISKEETLKLYSEKFNMSPEKMEESFRGVYEENTIRNDELYKFVVGLKTKGYKLAILSTQFHLSKEILIPQKYYNDFDALEISCDDGLKKPHEKTFRAILDKLKIKPEEGLFVDDKQENLDAAEALGMKSLIFKTNGQFIGDITKLFEESESVRKEK